MACFGADSIPRHIISGAKTSAQILDLFPYKTGSFNSMHLHQSWSDSKKEGGFEIVITMKFICVIFNELS